MITGIQLVGVLFALFMFYLTFLHQKRREFTAKEYTFWTMLWAVFVLITLFPSSLEPFVKGVLDVQRPIDFFIILGFMLIIGMIFHVYVVLRKTQNKVEDIVRKMALNKRR